MLNILDFKEIRKLLKKETIDSSVLKVALLGNSATQFLAQAISAYGIQSKIGIQLFEADFNQIERQIHDPSSELYSFAPDIVVLFLSSHSARTDFYHRSLNEKRAFAEYELEKIQQLCETIFERTSAKIILNNLPEIPDGVFGNYAAKTEYSFLYQLRELNYKVQKFAVDVKGLYVLDLMALRANYGALLWHDNQMYVNAEMVFSLEATSIIAAHIIDIIGAMQGRIVKCVILDLDNTLWGGIIGDDGLEKIQIGHLGIGKAFSEFQLWLKQLKQRGIVLAVCSKNNEEIAREPFISHPDMILKLDDIAVFIANWETKIDNIRNIQSILNIGFDSLVFLDDNPFERNIVRENIADIIVPELPEDPSEYLSYIQGLNLFETIVFTGEDDERTRQYQVESKRKVFEKSFASEAEFLTSIQMKSEVKAFDSFTFPRVAELTQRSNQFNLRTVRYTEMEIEAIANSEKFVTFSFTLTDKFGDNGLISLIILEKQDSDTLFINTWLMSCRVLKRSMEQFVLNTIVEIAKNSGYKRIIGEYIPTPKNAMVKEHYPSLGFSPFEDNNKWILEVESYKNGVTYIEKI